MVLGGFLAGGLSPPPARNGSGILSDTSVELKAFLGRMLEVPVHPSPSQSRRLRPGGPAPGPAPIFGVAPAPPPLGYRGNGAILNVAEQPPEVEKGRSLIVFPASRPR